jgi:hypothetical protein
MSKSDVVAALKALGVDDLFPVDQPIFDLVLAEAEKLAPQIQQMVKNGAAPDAITASLVDSGIVKAAAYRVQRTTSEVEVKVAIADAAKPISQT